MRFHDFRVIIFFFLFFFFKPAISLFEPVETLISSLNVSGGNGGVHGRQAIVSLRLDISRVDVGSSSC